jgi:hypothetical protein
MGGFTESVSVVSGFSGRVRHFCRETSLVCPNVMGGFTESVSVVSGFSRTGPAFEADPR